VSAGVSGETSHIRLNYRNCGLRHEKSQYRISLQKKKVTLIFISELF
jgi:hypothetical protein